MLLAVVFARAHPARALFGPRTPRGSLAFGADADFVLLGGWRGGPKAAAAALEVRATFVGGAKVWEKQGSQKGGGASSSSS